MADRVVAAQVVLRVQTVRVPGADKVDEKGRGEGLEKMGRGDYQVTDREKVMASLKACAREDTVSCEKAGCKYCDADDCTGALARDVLELMKEQEAGEPGCNGGDTN